MSYSTQYISPSAESLWSYFRACYRYIRLVWVFVERDLRIKYAQTWIGLGWTLIQPLISVLLYALVFGSLFGGAFVGNHYIEQLCVGVVAWSFFYYVAQQSSTALLQQKELIEKMVFPRLLLLLSKAGVAVVDLALGLVVLCIFLSIRGWMPTMHYLALPLAVITLLIEGLCVGVWFTALSIRSRDLQHLLPMALHALLWLSPVFYTSQQTEGLLGWILPLNPLSEAITLFRWALMDGRAVLPSYLGVGTVVMSLLLVWGVIRLKKAEENLSDVL